jgi:ribonuclease HI
MAFTDGASIENPGKSGAGVSFFGVNPASELRPLHLSDSGSSEVSSADEFD